MLRANFFETKRTTRRAKKALAFGLAMMFALLWSFGLQAANPAHAATTFTVNSTGDGNDLDFPGGTFDGSSDGKCDVDSGTPEDQCTLRAAIQEANVTTGADTIAFNIPDSLCSALTKVCTISPGSELPRITDTVTIDSYTQRPCFTDTGQVANPPPCSKPNTNPDLADGTNANLLIELNGTNAGTGASGFVVGGLTNAFVQNNVIKGLVINSFGRAGIYIFDDAEGTKVEGNFIGTDPSGILPRGNRDDAGVVAANGNIIGGTSPAARNVISSNGFSGVLLAGSGIRVEGNYIGTDKDGDDPLGNNIAGVLVLGVSHAIGGTTAGTGNVIGFNKGDGVTVRNFTGDVSNRILGNSIFSNDDPASPEQELGIDLGPDGPTANDKKDPDTGSNNLQNFPVLTSVTPNPDDTHTIKGRLNSRPRKSFTIQFFSSDQADPSTFGEGKKFIGEITVKTNRRGSRSFSFTTPSTTLFVGEAITATATNNRTGDTSEFSKACTVPAVSCPP